MTNEDTASAYDEGQPVRQDLPVPGQQLGCAFVATFLRLVHRRIVPLHWRTVPGRGSGQAPDGEGAHLGDPFEVAVDVDDAEPVMHRGLRDQ